jgi:hypothetical protein
MTPQVYVLIAKRDASSTDALKVMYESREHALAAAAVLREYCPIVAVTVGDGSEVEGPHA